MMLKAMKLLLIDDDMEFSELLSLILKRKGYSVDMASSGETGLEMMKRNAYDVVLTDMRMAGMSGIDVIRAIKSLSYPEFVEPECIMITGYGSIDNAVDAIRNGAFSYFIKSKDPESLIFDLEKIRKIRALERENVKLKADHPHSEYMLQSKSPSFMKLLTSAQKVAKTEANVLLLGESGVGKEVLARFIHHSSNRQDQVFMPVNCFSFSDSMFEAELFGHEKGAFTGATEARVGRFEAAHNGTLFLDEIGDLPHNFQVKLLRSIENKEIERIGSNRSVKTDFRLISATNKNLESAVTDKSFREDLFYRLNTITLVIPPLRERKEDLPLLIDFFLKSISHDMKKKIMTMDEHVIDKLVRYHYPGNVRELKNIVERLVVFSDGPVITMDDLMSNPVLPLDEIDLDEDTSDTALRRIRLAAEKQHIQKIMAQTHDNVELAAKLLEISTRQLYNKLGQFK